MLDKYVEKSGKKLRYGYTTGTCATVAAKAAAMMLLHGVESKELEIHTPKGWDIVVPIESCSVEGEIATAIVLKDSGDDPDITNGIEIGAHVSVREDSLVNIYGGIGVGEITRVGLSVDVGKSAINPVPMDMIRNAIEDIRNYGFENCDTGLDIEIFVPEGAEIAKKTFNPKLGIEGGISIIGTTGIVEPMSEDALKESLYLELSMKQAEGIDRLIFSPGNYGRDFAEEIDLDISNLVKTSNFIGDMLENAVKFGIKEILWIGHIGKMVKVAGGIFNTHSRIADGRVETLAANLACLGASQEVVQRIMTCITTDEAIGIIQENDLMEVFKVLAQKITQRSEDKVHGEIKVGTVIFSRQYGWLGQCNYAQELMEAFKNG